MEGKAEPAQEPGEHPRGTLAVVGLYGILSVLGWFAVYIWIYLARGPITP